MSSNSVEIFFPKCGKKGVQTETLPMNSSEIQERGMFKKGIQQLLNPSSNPKFCQGQTQWVSHPSIVGIHNKNYEK